jgi:hypothetical protein
MQSAYQRGISTPVCITEQSTIANMDQPKGSAVNVWIKKVFVSHKKNEILSFVTAWMKLENILLREIRQAKKDK